MTYDRKPLIGTAMGRTRPDFVIHAVELVNVLSREIHTADILVKDERIAAVLAPGGQYDAETRVIEGQGLYAVPGFIDPHVHLESSMVCVAEYARAVLPRGTTMIAADPHEMGNVLGAPGMRVLLDEAAATPLRVRLRVPGRIPAVPDWIETSNAALNVKDTRDLFDWPEALCLAGDINPALVLDEDAEQLEKFAMAKALGVLISGQSPGLRGRDLCAFLAAGPEDSHVASDVDEIIENTRLGMSTVLALRPGRRLGPDQMHDLAGRVRKGNLDTRLFQLCTDDIQAHDLLHEGHLDHRIRCLIASGFDTVTAYQIATINVAQGLRIAHDHGSISPGKVADIVLLDDLEKVSVRTTIAAGKIIYDHGVYFGPRTSTPYPDWCLGTIRYAREIKPEDLALRPVGNARTATVRCLIAGEPGAPKSVREVAFEVRDGCVMPDPDNGLVAAAMIERHKGSGDVGLGMTDCVKLKRGAIACSINHDAHNIGVFGVNFADMALAANRLAEIGGGYVLTADGMVVEELALPIAGLMSQKPIEEVAAGMKRVEAALFDILGAERREKLLTDLSFLALPNIPDFGFTNKGLVASRGEITLVDALTGA